MAKKENTSNISKLLRMEISKISFFTLSWTIVHALNEQRPIQHFTDRDLEDGNAVIMVLVKGMDDASQQTVHARRSCVAPEIVWNAKFSSIVDQSAAGIPRLLTGKIDLFQRLDS